MVSGSIGLLGYYSLHTAVRSLFLAVVEKYQAAATLMVGACVVLMYDRLPIEGEGEV